MQDNMKELTDRLNKYRDFYYNKNKSLVSDEEYDRLFDQLSELEKKEGRSLPNSPTQSVGYSLEKEVIVDKLEEVTHNHLMLSLDKTKNVEDIIRFAGNQGIVVMPKMDGLTCTLRYINGKLESAETRGDGTKGELITHNAMVMRSVPKTLDTTLPEVIVDGELMITYADFNRINEELKLNGASDEDLFANPRNLAAGTARQLNSAVCSSRNLQFVAWKCVKGPYCNSFTTMLVWLERMGFNVVSYTYMKNPNQQTLEYEINEIQSWAKIHDYKIDGAVIGYDNIAYGESLGVTKHHPRNQIAFKFYDEKYPSVLRDVKWTMGKTGIITPTAIFDPVEIDGTTVCQASMHNITIMKELNAQVGKTCYVFKANMIIPQIESFDSESFGIDIPKYCPECGSLTIISMDNKTEVLKCTNSRCKGKQLKKLEAFVGKSGMDIDGLGGATLELFFDRGWIRTFVDIYNLERDYGDRIPFLPGWSDKSASKLFKSIDKSRNVKLDKFLSALSITNVSSGTAKVICEYFNYDDNKLFENIRFATEEVCSDWAMIPGIGDKTAKDIYKWYQENNFDLWSVIDYINFIKPEKKDNTTAHPDVCEKTFCITGTFSESRDILKQKIEAVGGIFVSSVSKNTDILFVGDKAGSKLEKAKKLGVTIYNEDKLMEILR